MRGQLPPIEVDDICIKPIHISFYLGIYSLYRVMSAARPYGFHQPAGPGPSKIDRPYFKADAVILDISILCYILESHD